MFRYITLAYGTIRGMNVKIISRVVLISERNVLLIKNIDKDYWSLPGGHWESNIESLRECAIRETLEETGFAITVDRLLFVQEFSGSKGKVIEFIWLVRLLDGQQLDNLNLHKDIDPDSEIEKINWFKLEDISGLAIRPAMVKSYLIDGDIGSNFFET